MLHFLRFDPEQQRLFNTKEHHRFVEELCLATAVQYITKDQHFDPSAGDSGSWEKKY